jgi:hypothetical protein
MGNGLLFDADVVDGRAGLHNASLWRTAESIFSLLMNPIKRAKRASLGRRSFDRILVGKKSILDAVRQRYAFVQPCSPEGTFGAS